MTMLPFCLRFRAPQDGSRSGRDASSTLNKNRAAPPIYLGYDTRHYVPIDQRSLRQTGVEFASRCGEFSTILSPRV